MTYMQCEEIINKPPTVQASHTISGYVSWILFENVWSNEEYIIQLYYNQ